MGVSFPHAWTAQDPDSRLHADTLLYHKFKIPGAEYSTGILSSGCARKLNGVLEVCVLQIHWLFPEKDYDKQKSGVWVDRV